MTTEQDPFKLGLKSPAGEVIGCELSEGENGLILVPTGTKVELDDLALVTYMVNEQTRPLLGMGSTVSAMEFIGRALENRSPNARVAVIGLTPGAEPGFVSGLSVDIYESRV